jgi:hypothetical protein
VISQLFRWNSPKTPHDESKDAAAPRTGCLLDPGLSRLSVELEDMKLRLATAAREVDLDHLPSIDKFTRQIDQDRGYEL